MAYRPKASLRVASLYCFYLLHQAKACLINLPYFTATLRWLIFFRISPAFRPASPSGGTSPHRCSTVDGVAGSASPTSPFCSWRGNMKTMTNYHIHIIALTEKFLFLYQQVEALPFGSTAAQERLLSTHSVAAALRQPLAQWNAGHSPSALNTCRCSVRFSPERSPIENAALQTCSISKFSSFRRPQHHCSLIIQVQRHSSPPPGNTFIRQWSQCGNSHPPPFTLFSPTEMQPWYHRDSCRAWMQFQKPRASHL